MIFRPNRKQNVQLVRNVRIVVHGFYIIDIVSSHVHFTISCVLDAQKITTIIQAFSDNSKGAVRFWATKPWHHKLGTW